VYPKVFIVIFGQGLLRSDSYNLGKNKMKQNKIATTILWVGTIQFKSVGLAETHIFFVVVLIHKIY
jgi:hypothetical protein